MKRSVLFLLLPLLGALALTSCGPQVRYVAQDLPQATRSHQEIAILPVEISYAGPLPEDITQREMIAMDIGESRMYSRSLYHALLNRADKNVQVQIQPLERTQALLNARDINIHESWQMDPRALANLLGVDAVVRMHIDETRFLSEKAAAGIQMARWFWAGPYGPYGPGPVRTAEVRASVSLFSADDGQLLWKYGLVRDASWQHPPEEVVEDLNRKIARNFPYEGA